MKNPSRATAEVVGLDLGDRYSRAIVLERLSGDVVEEFRLRTTTPCIKRLFALRPPALISLEVGTHSRWVSALLSELGHEVLVANARKVRLISTNRRKDDRIDAQNLARLARADPRLLAPVSHRSEQAHLDLAVIRSRDALVRARSQLINHCRGLVKTTGHRLPSSSAPSFARKARASLPEALHCGLDPVLEQIATLTAQIRAYDRQLEELARDRYPETSLLTQVPGVGVLTALTYVLTLEDPRRFSDGRQVAAYLGLVPGRHDSGEVTRPGRITKEGDPMLRRLLVQCAHYIRGPFGPDCELRQFSQRLTARGGRYAQKKAIIAVARKLAGLLHRLWLQAEVYDPFFNANRSQQQAV